MRARIEQRLIGVILLMLAILVIVAVTAVRNNNRALASSDWVNHTHAVKDAATDILSLLNSGDAALRNYLITGDKRDQGAYRQAYAAMKEALDLAKASTRAPADGAQNKEFLQLEKLLTQRIDFTRAVVKARETDGLDAARKALEPDATGETLAAITRLVSQVNAEENKLLVDRDRESFLKAKATTWTVEAGIAANFLLLCFSGWLIRDDLSARGRATAVLQEANDQLEAKVQQRTAELVKTNQALKQENLERRWSNQATEHQLKYNQLIINSISELVFVISKALNVSRINPAVVHQTGFDAQEIIAQRLDRVLQVADDPTPGATPGHTAISLAMKEGREIQERAASVICKSGQTLTVRFNLVPLRDQDKVVGGVVTVRISQAGAARGA